MSNRLDYDNRTPRSKTPLLLRNSVLGFARSPASLHQLWKKHFASQLATIFRTRTRATSGPTPGPSSSTRPISIINWVHGSFVIFVLFLSVWNQCRRLADATKAPTGHPNSELQAATQANQFILAIKILPIATPWLYPLQQSGPSHQCSTIPQKGLPLHTSKKASIALSNANMPLDEYTAADGLNGSSQF